MDCINRSWVEVSIEKLKKNYRIYKDNIPADKTVMAVVKANAYGHGDTKVAKLLNQIGCFHFAVSNIEEAIGLRKADIEGSILILGYTPINQAEQLEKFDITQTLISESYAEALNDTGFKIKSQFAIDTGMNRIGLDADYPEECERVIRKYANCSNLIINGMFTHLCVADTDDEKCIQFTKEQIYKFERMAARVGDLNLKEVHCLNSAAGIWHESERSIFVRLGIIMYGLKPDYLNYLPDGIEPVLEWKSVISMVKTVRKGETIGYGRTFMAEKNMTVATIPTGYADGYNRLLSNHGYVLINGQRAPIVGRVCMDQFMVDVSCINNADMGTEVILIGKCGEEMLTADDMAQMIDTIGYEVVCNISSRVNRVYL